MSVILTCLTKETTEKGIVDTLADKFVVSREDMAEDVRSVIAKLRAI